MRKQVEFKSNTKIPESLLLADPRNEHMRRNVVVHTTTVEAKDSIENIADTDIPMVLSKSLEITNKLFQKNNSDFDLDLKEIYYKRDSSESIMLVITEYDEDRYYIVIHRLGDGTPENFALWIAREESLEDIDIMTGLWNPTGDAAPWELLNGGESYFVKDYLDLVSATGFDEDSLNFDGHSNI